MSEEEQALKTEAEEEVSQDSPPESEPKATEEAEQPDQVEEAEPVKKKGAEQRIRQLNKRAKNAEGKVQTLEERLRQITTIPDQPQQGPLDEPSQKQEPIVKAGEELTEQELETRLAAREQRILQQADSLGQLRARQIQAYSNIQRESSEVMKLYPQLDPDSNDQFDQDLSESITEATEAFVKSNPTGSVKQFVTKLMKPYEKSVAKGVEEKAKDVSRQLVESATRPTSISKGEKDFASLSIKEMEEKLGTVI